MKDVLALLLLPGTGIRRWLLMGGIGGLVFAIGVGYTVRFYSSVGIPNFLPGIGEAILFLSLSLILVVASATKLMTLVSTAKVASLPDESLRASMMRIRGAAHAPRFVTLGGGTGLSTLLRGLKEHSHLTGIVTVADDGGSSGRLRTELGMLPPGDIRNCIVALADTEPLMKDLFQYRFPAGSQLEGHSFGNLFIAAMSGVTGSFEEAVNESNRVLNVRGRIVPSTLDNVTLIAEIATGERVAGESNIPHSGGRIDRVQIVPDKPRAYEGALDAISEAQLIIVGPGSLYTSIIPNLIVPGIAEAIQASSASVVYVCNVATQPGETDGYSVADHIAALQLHSPALGIDYVIANHDTTDLGIDYAAEHVWMGDMSGFAGEIVQADLMSDSFRPHHDPQKLANAVLHIYHGEESTNGRRFRNGNK